MEEGLRSDQRSADGAGISMCIALGPEFGLYRLGLKLP